MYMYMRISMRHFEKKSKRNFKNMLQMHRIPKCLPPDLHPQPFMTQSSPMPGNDALSTEGRMTRFILSYLGPEGTLRDKRTSARSCSHKSGVRRKNDYYNLLSKDTDVYIAISPLGKILFGLAKTFLTGYFPSE